MELVAKGSQDIYLTGNPQITFFKTLYKRHTNFSIESIEQTFKGDVDFGLKTSIVLSRAGDLVSDIILEINIPEIKSTTSNSENIKWMNSLGHGIIKEIDLEIGGTVIDKQYGEWLEIWSELSLDYSKKQGYRTMIGNLGSDEGFSGPYTLYVPLKFWFCRNIGLALPLIALQYHEVAINIKFRPFNECWINDSIHYYKAYKQGDIVYTVNSNKPFINDIYQNGGDVNSKIYWPDGSIDTISEVLSEFSVRVGTSSNKGSLTNPIYNVYIKTDENAIVNSILSARAFCDYIYLDTIERRKFAQISHNYLIEQVQFNGDKTYIEGQRTEKIELDFNHPTKEIIWIQQSNNVKDNNDWFNFSATTDIVERSFEPIDKVILYLNGQERFSERKGSYFRLVQPYQRHTSIPDSSGTKYIYAYSFGLNPEEHQPSGTCNFSRIDNSDLHIVFRNPKDNDLQAPPMPGGAIRIYAINYNVLRIQNGMGGLAYSN